MEQLVGRAAEIDDVVRRIDAAVGGAGSAMLFVGEAGVGKSSLLDAIGRRADTRMTVLRAGGVEDETGFTWSGLASLIRPLLRAHDHVALAPSRQRVLDSALFLVDEPADAVELEPYSLSLALFDLVTAAALRCPVLVLIDDLHWVDPASARVLSFLARRLDREYVAMIATSRPSLDAPAFPAVVLDPPTAPEADAILRQHGVGSAAVRAALIDAVGTNPLMLINSAADLSADVRRGRLPIPDPLPFPRTVIEGANRRLAMLDAATREALAAIAVLGRPSLREAQRMLGALGAELDVLESAERAGVLEIADPIRFSHPTLRTAAHSAVTSSQRRRIHRLASEVVGHDPVTRTMHLAAAAIGPSADIADALEHAAEQLASRGAAAVAAEQFGRAAQLSTDDAGAARCRRRGAELYLDLGLIEAARAMLGNPGAADDDPAIARAWARLLHVEERDDEACALLRKAAASVSASSPDDAARLLIECLAPLVREARLGDLFDVAGELQVLRPRVAGAIAARIDATTEVFAMLGGGSLGGMEPVDALIESEGVTRAAPFLAEVIAPALAYARRDDTLGAMLDTVERALRERAAIVPLISVLAAQQLRHFGVRQPLSIEAGEEAIRLADEIGCPKLAMMAAFGLSVGASVAGDAVGYRRAADLLSTSTYPHAEAARLVGLGVLHLSAGRLEQSLDAWLQVIERDGFGNPLLTFEADYLETLTRLGRVEEARALLDRFDDEGIAARSPATLGRVRAMVAADDAQAGALFQVAVDLFHASNNRIGEGRTELAWGERLRRRRRRAEARLHLERARDVFRGVGVPGWAARAEAELVASGAVVDATLPAHALLTSQELRVGRLVAGGSSNRDIAVELFISERTVETHLTAIFRKLQIKNRRELAARALVDADLRPPAQ